MPWLQFSTPPSREGFQTHYQARSEQLLMHTRGGRWLCKERRYQHWRSWLNLTSQQTRRLEWEETSPKPHHQTASKLAARIGHPLVLLPTTMVLWNELQIGTWEPTSAQPFAPHLLASLYPTHLSNRHPNLRLLLFSLSQWTYGQISRYWVADGPCCGSAATSYGATES